IVIYIAARFIISGELSLGMLYAFISYKDQFVTRMGSFIDNAVELKMVSVHLERLSDVVFTPIEGNIINYDNNERFEGDIEVKGISFRHSDFEGYIFTDLSFHVKPGESVVIVGPSGRGKTTLLKCMMGLLKTSTGQILSNGIEISKLPNFRTKIAAVMQDDSLFTGSIIENITFFDSDSDSDFDMSWVITCAKTAAIHDDIEAMPMGYHSLIGDMGTVFSGGQKQRILLARALYVKPRILFLDEATSSLDSELEHIVNSNIKSLNITRICIAHRGDTIRSADRVIELK
ncbi:ATP-binding cassette domain-containing protein, partial [Vibrio aestuarianus subsp. cardii]